MKVATWKKIDEKTETYQVWVEESQDENGNIIEGHYEERSRTVPVYGTVYEEVDDIPHEEIQQMPTESERIEALEMAMLDLLEVLANG
jgi:hypothetical protein